MNPRDNQLTKGDQLNLAAGGVSTLVALAELYQGDYSMAFLASASALLTAGGTVSKFGVEKSKEGLQTITRGMVSGGIAFGTGVYNLGCFGYSTLFGSSNKKAAEARKHVQAEELQNVVDESFAKPKTM